MNTYLKIGFSIMSLVHIDLIFLPSLYISFYLWYFSTFPLDFSAGKERGSD